MTSTTTRPSSAASAASPADEPTPQLRRSLGYFDLVAYGLAYLAIIAPLTSLGLVWEASSGQIASAYVLGAVCMYFTAQSYATMTEEVPTCGSVYGFARHALGEFPGFMAGWLVLLDYLLIPALVYALMSVGMNLLIPEISRAGWICIVVLTSVAFNWFGIQVTSRISQLSVVIQFFMLVGVLVLALRALQGGAGTGGLTAAPFVGAAGVQWPAVLAGASLAVMTFLGFDAVSTLSEETRAGQSKMVGRAILSVLAVAAVLFVLAAWVLGNLMPAIRMQDQATAIFELLGQTVGPWAPILLAWLLAIVVGFTNALPMQASVARVLFAMGRDGQLPQALGRLHAASGVPRMAMLAATAVSLPVALLLRDQIDLLASLISCGALAGFALLHMAVLAHFHRQPERRRLFLHVIVPVLGLAVVLSVARFLNAHALAVGGAWLVVGLVYGWLQRARRPTRMA